MTRDDAIAVLTKENLAKYDALFFYTTGSLLPAGEPREALLDFVKQGKGFIDRITNLAFGCVINF